MLTFRVPVAWRHLRRSRRSPGEVIANDFSLVTGPVDCGETDL
jgi:hypothetical protein